MTQPEIDGLIELFHLQPLPVEGGLLAQTYLSADRVPNGKPYSTAVVYLLTSDADSFSALHRLPTDEIWHFYLGDPVEQLNLWPDGRAERVVLGHDVFNGQRVQHLAPCGVWQGSRLIPGGRWALLGTTMAPGFTPPDYEGAEREALARQFPDWAALIAALTRPVAPTTMP